MPDKNPKEEKDQHPKNDTVYFEKTVEWFYVKKHLEGFGAPMAGLLEQAGDALVGTGIEFVIIEFKKSDKEIPDERRKYPSTRYDFKLLKKRAIENEKNPSLEKHKLPEVDILLESSIALEKIIETENSKRKPNEPNKTHHPHLFVYGNLDSSNKINDVKASHYWGDWVDIRSIYVKDNKKIKRNRYDYESIIDQSDHLPTSVKSILIDGKIGDLAHFRGKPFIEFTNYVNDVVIAKGGAIETAAGGWMFASVLGILGNGDSATTVTMTMWEFCDAFQHVLAGLKDTPDNKINNREILAQLSKEFAEQISIKPDQRPLPTSDDDLNGAPPPPGRGSGKRTLSYKPPGFG